MIQTLVLLTALTAPNAEPTPAEPSGEQAVLRVGETRRLGGGRLAVTFERVLSDSRCPDGVQCFWAGDATVMLGVRSGSEGEPSAVELHTFGGARRPREALVEGFRLTLARLEPNARVGGLKAEEYRLTLRVTLVNAH